MLQAGLVRLGQAAMFCLINISNISEFSNIFIMAEASKLTRHKSSCTIILKPIKVPPQKQICGQQPSIMASASSSTSLSYLSDVPSSSESEADSFHSSVSESKAPHQSAVESVRTMTENFQKLLSQVFCSLKRCALATLIIFKATSEIKKIKKENAAIELEQTNLLNINEELSRETERLAMEESSWEFEREVKFHFDLMYLIVNNDQELLRANAEFVEEVKKLYEEEDQWKIESQCLLDKRKCLEEEYQKDKDDLNESIIKERSLHHEQMEQLNNSIKILNIDNINLKEEITNRLEQSLKTEEVSINFEY